MTVSSANLTVWWLSDSLRQSFVHMIYKGGERTQPWGEPADVIDCVEKCSLTVTLRALLVGKSKIQPTMLKSNTKRSVSFFTSRWGCMVLNTDEKSTNNSLACFLLPSKCLYMKLRRVTLASCTPLLMPYANSRGSRRCSVLHSSSISKQFFKWFNH